jgi:hypothetical protein
MTSWKVGHSKKQDYEQLNTSWDIWLGQADEQNPGAPSVEVMIWLNHVAQYPIGQKVDNINVWGENWDVWRGNIGWDVFSFVNTKGIWEVNNVNIMDFFEYLWEKKNWLDGRKYICGIENGNEVMDGEGGFTWDYKLKVN